MAVRAGKGRVVVLEDTLIGPIALVTNAVSLSLQEAISKSSSDPTTLANLVVCYQHMRKPADVIARYTNQMLALAPDHPWAAKFAEMQTGFDRCEAQFSKA